MKTNTLFISFLFVLSILISACAPAAAINSTANSGSQPGSRTLTISGSGKISLKPDFATVSVGIHTEKPTAAEAVAENNANSQKLIDALKAAGVGDNIQTSNFSIWQNNLFGTDGKPTGSNYAVDNTVFLTVRNLDKLGDLLDTAVKAGANNINSIQFDAADKTKALSAARIEAVKTAKAQAEELATAAGVTLGAIQSIQYYDGSPSPITMNKGYGGSVMSADIAVPINPGQLEITASVTIVYEIK